MSSARNVAGPPSAQNQSARADAVVGDRGPAERGWSSTRDAPTRCLRVARWSNRVDDGGADQRGEGEQRSDVFTSSTRIPRQHPADANSSTGARQASCVGGAMRVARHQARCVIDQMIDGGGRSGGQPMSEARTARGRRRQAGTARTCDDRAEHDESQHARLVKS